MYIFIVNPHARSGLGHVVWDELESILKKQNIPYKAYFTKYQKHATEIARKATSDVLLPLWLYSAEMVR